jgi:hypothetical protein
MPNADWKMDMKGLIFEIMTEKTLYKRENSSKTGFSNYFGQQ